MKDGLFDERTLALQRQYLIDTIEAEINDKRRYAMMKTVSLMFEGEAFGEDRFGTVEGAKAITAEETAAAYRRIIDEATVEILHVGRGDPACAKEVCTKAFSSLTRQPVDIPKTEIQMGSGEVKNVTERFNVSSVSALKVTFSRTANFSILCGWRSPFWAAPLLPNFF